MRTKQASGQEIPTTSSANDDQIDLVINIKKITREEFDKHEKKIDETIKLHLQSNNEDVTEVPKSLEFTQSMLNEELGTMKNEIKKLGFDIRELENDLLDSNEVLGKLIELEDGS